MKDPKTVEKTRAVFLDRDGVINVDHGYVHKVDQLEFIAGTFEALLQLQDMGFALIIVTNQSGVARGFYKESDVRLFHQAMDQCLRDKGVQILSWYYCPHHTEATIEEYRIQCSCRKPSPGMIQSALKDFPNINPQNSYMVGDRKSDIECGLAMGLNTIQILSQKYPMHPDAHSYKSSLKDALPLFK